MRGALYQKEFYQSESDMRHDVYVYIACIIVLDVLVMSNRAYLV